jgi:signal transduction histidine kinase
VTLRELGVRYWALGLPAAAASAFERAGASAELAALRASRDGAATGGAIDPRVAALEQRARDVEALGAADSMVSPDRAAMARDARALAIDPDPALSPADRARAWIVMAGLVDGPLEDDAAEAALRRALALQPGHVAAACRLALLVSDRGDHAGALAEVQRALAKRPASERDTGSPQLAAVVSRLLDAAAPQLGAQVLELARHDALAGVYAHGHRVKNLLGVIGARARSARKHVERGSPDAGTKLRELETDVTALYEEWASYLRTLQSPAPQAARCPLAPILRDAVATARTRAPDVPISVEASDDLELRGDRLLLREAIVNLVVNAAEACAATGAPVAIRARATDSHVEIAVADRGPGIPRAHRARLFEPGFTTKPTGSGVGLAVVHRVATAHGGSVSIDSDDATGTTVTLSVLR